MSTHRTCKTLPIKKKQEIILAVKSGEKQSNVAKKFNIASSTVTSILKKSDLYLELPSNSKCKRQKEAEFPKLEEHLLTWFTQCRHSNLPLSGTLLIEKAKIFALKLGIKNFKASNGWFENFKRRHNITFRKICGESAAVDATVCSEWKDKIKKLIVDYDSKNIFNADETGLFYKCLPDRSMTLKGEICHGGKLSKERVTFLLGANMDGSEKLKPLMIGKSLKPRCFKNIKTFPMTYRANKKAWMTRNIFSEWLHSLNTIMVKQNRHIILFIDNCQAHYEEDSLSHVRIEFLPPNTTSTLQPLDGGIIKNFKTFYRKEVVSRLIDSMDDKTKLNLSIYDAMNIAHKAWNNVSEITIKNCFRACGFPDISNEIMQPEEIINIPEWDQLQLSDENPISFRQYVLVDEYVAVTGTLSTNEILDLNSETDELDETEEVPEISSKMAKAAIKTLQHYFMTSNVDEHVLNDVVKLDNVIDKMRQAKCN